MHVQNTGTFEEEPFLAELVLDTTSTTAETTGTTIPTTTTTTPIIQTERIETVSNVEQEGNLGYRILTLKNRSHLKKDKNVDLNQLFLS